MPVVPLEIAYVPSDHGAEFHCAESRFRDLVWGIKSGKTFTGAAEFLRWVLGLPGTYSWMVAPTLGNLDEAESNVIDLLDEMEIPFHTRTAKREYIFANGSSFRCRSGEIPNNLRGPNIDGIIWIDEKCYLSYEAWLVIRGRVTATGAGIFGTSTPPEGRNWTWAEFARAGMPADAEYGDNFSEDRKRFISHHPTWEFPWVEEEELDDERQGMPRVDFDREYGAKFMSSKNQVFEGVEECLSREPPPKDFTGATTLGLDLAKMQDYSAVVVMNPAGRVLHVDRWRRMKWRQQKPKIAALALKWNSIIVMDVSNVGSVIYEDLVAEELNVVAVDMNSPVVKNSVVEGLMMAFEKGSIRLPHPNAPWSPTVAKHLVNELGWYEARLTPGKRLSYGAPKNLHDDLVIALGLSVWGRTRGMSGGVIPADVIVPRNEWAEALEKGIITSDQIPRPKAENPALKKIFGRKSRWGQSTGGSFWSQHGNL